MHGIDWVTGQALNSCLRVCSRRPVCGAAELMQVLEGVLKLRAHCPTLIHSDSSRSHLIVTLTVSSKSPNALALGKAPPTPSQSLFSLPPSWLLPLQPAGCREPRGTCGVAPPRGNGGAHAAAGPVPPLCTSLQMSSSPAPPPPLAHPPHHHRLRVPPPDPAARRRCSGPSCSWWTWQAVSALVRGTT